MSKQPVPERDIDPMEEAYKLLGGEPAQDAVSIAAKGGVPETDEQQRERTNMKPDEVGTDIEEAYANLFASLSVILRRK